jgi:hypothetical protein
VRADQEQERNSLLFQPEAFLIFQALETAPYRLREAWPSERLPIDLLEGMVAVWGLDLEEQGVF